MKLSLIVVALLSALGSCGDIFAIDNLAVKESWWRDAGVPWTGSSCTFWVKNGNNDAIHRHGISDAPYSYWSYSDTRYLHYFNFPSSQTVSRNSQTYLWTNCDDALLIDYMYLGASDGSRTWGGDNAYAWCLSTDWSDGKRFNDKSQDIFDWDVISAGGCYSTFRLETNGKVSGWIGWTPTYWQRRALVDAAEAANVPSTAEVNACVADESRPAEECDDLVNQILSFEIEHPEGFQRAVQFPINENVLDNATPEEDDDETDTQTASDDRRVLSAQQTIYKVEADNLCHELQGCDLIMDLMVSTTEGWVVGKCSDAGHETSCNTMDFDLGCPGSISTFTNIPAFCDPAMETTTVSMSGGTDGFVRCEEFTLTDCAYAFHAFTEEHEDYEVGNSCADASAGVFCGTVQLGAVHCAPYSDPSNVQMLFVDQYASTYELCEDNHNFSDSFEEYFSDFDDNNPDFETQMDDRRVLSVVKRLLEEA